MFDFVKKNGKYTFEELPFCEVDNLIFTSLSYLYFEDVVNDSFDNVRTIETIAKTFEAEADIEEMLKETIFMKETILLFHKMARTVRYKNIRLEHYVTEIDFEKEKQFAAITFVHPQFVYVAFRGTDNIIISWKEDCNIAYIEPVPAQKDATEYLEEVISRFNQNVYVGGHSKGGNLAIYAATHIDEKYRNKIMSVFNFDGPGFSNRKIWEENEEWINQKVRTILPQGSIVGTLMETGGPKFVVKSIAIGILQHSPFSWQTLEDGFVYLEDRTKQSYEFEENFNRWFRGLSPEKTKFFIDTSFDLILSSGITTTNQLSLPILYNAVQSFKEFSDEEKEYFISLIIPLVEPIFSEKNLIKKGKRLLGTE